LPLLSFLMPGKSSCRIGSFAMRELLKSKARSSKLKVAMLEFKLQLAWRKQAEA